MTYREPRQLPAPYLRRHRKLDAPDRGVRGPLAVVALAPVVLTLAVGWVGLLVLVPVAVLAWACGMKLRRVWR